VPASVLPSALPAPAVPPALPGPPEPPGLPPPSLRLLSPLPVPPALRPWVSGHAQSRPGVIERLDPAQPVCWLIDGDDEAFCRSSVQALQALGLFDDTPWLLWLPDPGRRVEREPLAWALGAVEVIDAGEVDRIGQRLCALGARLASPLSVHARQRQLRRQLQALQASVDNIPAPIFAKNAAGVYTDCNQAFLDYIGRRRDEVVGKTVYDIAPPELAKIYDEADRSLLASGQRHIYDAKVRWSDGSHRDVTFYKAVFHDEAGVPAGQAGAIFDITERRRLEQRLRVLAETDPLTGLLNRRSFIEQAAQRMTEAAAQAAPVALLVFDLDLFKQVNDHHGHATGDAMLCHVVQTVQAHLRSGDLLARLGGDEFAVMLKGTEGAEGIAARLPSAVELHPLISGPLHLPAHISLGAVVLDPRRHTVDSALHEADLALYEAKRRGRNQAAWVDSAPGLLGPAVLGD